LDLSAQKIDNNGSVVWPTTVMVCNAPGNQEKASIIPDGHGGAIIAWQDWRGLYADVYIQKINSNGIPLWTVNGLLIANADNHQCNAKLIFDNSTSSMLLWQDARTGDYDIYVTKLDNIYGDWWGKNAPAITSVSDVTYDHGGKVNVVWNPAGREVYPDTTITFYSVWRSLNGAKGMPSGAKLVRAEDLTKDFTGPAYLLSENDSKAYAWEWVANIPAAYQSAYAYMANTGHDDMSVYFMAITHTKDHSIFWKSAVASGYSWDNLAAGGVDPRLLDKCIQITWNTGCTYNSERWEIERAGDLQDAYTTVGSVLCPPNTDQTYEYCFVDNDQLAKGDYYYRLVLVDKDNSKYAYGPYKVSFVPAQPSVYQLSQNTPNPAPQGRTTITFSLKSPSAASLKVYNINGELVRTLTQGQRAAGRYTINWDGADARGRQLAAGVYLYQLVSPEGALTRRMTLIR
jgi:hypothetical protein